jgi:hypothetical protein
MIYEINFESCKDVYGPHSAVGNEEEYLRYVQDTYGKWVDELLRLKCKEAGLEIAPIDSPGENFVAPCDIIDTWVGEEYKIMLKSKYDACGLLTILEQALQEHGVYNERGLIYRATCDAMFKAMIVDNFLSELCKIVEDILSDYDTVDAYYGSLLTSDY